MEANDGRAGRYHALYGRESVEHIDFGGCDVITLNDEYHDNFYYGKAMLGKMLENLLPDKCEYETDHRGA